MPKGKETKADKLTLKPCPFCASRALGNLSCIDAYKQGDQDVYVFWVNCTDPNCWLG